MTKFLLTLWLLLVTGISVAQTFACQFVASAGLHWESSSWKTKTFLEEPPFFLQIMPNGDLSRESAHAVVGPAYTCITGSNKRITCMAAKQGFFGNGKTLIFDPDTTSGGVSYLIGSTESNSADRKDTLIVSPFICQKM